MTIFTILPLTKIIFLGVLPSKYLVICSSPNTLDLTGIRLRGIRRLARRESAVAHPAAQGHSDSR